MSLLIRWPLFMRLSMTIGESDQESRAKEGSREGRRQLMCGESTMEYS